MVRRSRRPGGTLGIGMAAGSIRRKMKCGGGVLPIVSGYWRIRDYCFRAKKKNRGAGIFGTCYRFPGRGNRSVSVATPDISF